MRSSCARASSLDTSDQPAAKPTPSPPLLFPRSDTVGTILTQLLTNWLAGERACPTQKSMRVPSCMVRLPLTEVTSPNVVLFGLVEIPPSVCRLNPRSEERRVG